jgi:hypothetical protein
MQQTSKFSTSLLLVWLALVLSLTQPVPVSAGFNAWTSIGPEGGWIYALAVDPNTPTTLYAGTYGGGVFKSTDGGATWSAVNTGLSNKSVWALAIDPTAPNTLYAGTYGGVFKSTDGGASWSANGLTGNGVFALAIDPNTPTTLYAGTNGGVFKSTNSGATWSATGTGPTNVRALVIDPTTPTTLYAGTNGGVFKSADGGVNWSATGAGPTNVRASAGNGPDHPQHALRRDKWWRRVQEHERRHELERGQHGPDQPRCLRPGNQPDHALRRHLVRRCLCAPASGECFPAAGAA